jgi:hypothetical protein
MRILVLIGVVACLSPEAASEASAWRRGTQTVLDQVLLRFGSEIVTKLDVRQARLLKLVDVPNDTDDAYVDAIANRRLILAELRRTAPAEPAADALDTAVRSWTARMSGGDIPGLLSRAGMSEAALRAWLKDDLRLQTYVSDRFGGRAADFAGWVSTLRQRAGLRSS